MAALSYLRQIKGLAFLSMPETNLSCMRRRLATTTEAGLFSLRLAVQRAAAKTMGAIHQTARDLVPATATTPAMRTTSMQAALLQVFYSVCPSLWQGR